MVVRKDNGYKLLRPAVTMERPLNQEHAIQAVGFIDRHSLDNDDRRLLFEALGYVPYQGNNTAYGKVTPAFREAQYSMDKYRGKE